MAKDAKDKLLNEAEKLFAEKGFDRVSIRDIARGAGVTSACISYHYGDKTQLYKAILKRNLKESQALVEQIKNQGYSPKEELKAHLKSMSERMRSKKSFCRLLAQTLLFSEDPKMKQLVREGFVHPMAHQLSQAIGKTQLKKNFSALKGEHFIALILGMPFHWNLFEDLFSKRKAAEIGFTKPRETALELVEFCIETFCEKG